MSVSLQARQLSLYGPFCRDLDTATELNQERFLAFTVGIMPPATGPTRTARVGPAGRRAGSSGWLTASGCARCTQSSGAQTGRPVTALSAPQAWTAGPSSAMSFVADSSAQSRMAAIQSSTSQTPRTSSLASQRGTSSGPTCFSSCCPLTSSQAVETRTRSQQSWTRQSSSKSTRCRAGSMRWHVRYSMARGTGQTRQQARGGA